MEGKPSVVIWSQSVSELVSLGSDLLWCNKKDICSLSLVPRPPKALGIS